MGPFVHERFDEAAGPERRQDPGCDAAADILGSVDHPREGGQLRDVGLYWSGDSETGCCDLAGGSGLFEKAGDHRCQGIELPRRVAASLARRRAGSVACEQTEPRLRAADVSCKDQPRHPVSFG